MSKLKDEHVFIDLLRGGDGSYCLCLGDGETGTRIAGQKLWGGGTIIRQWQVPVEEIESAIAKYRKQPHDRI